MLFVGFAQLAFAQSDVDTVSTGVLTREVEITISSNPHNIRSGHRVGAIGEFSMNSSALTNTFYDPFINGGKITTDIKDDVLNRTGGFNNIGLDLDYGFHYKQARDSLFGKEVEWSIFGTVMDRTHADGQFSENLFKLAVNGNKQFEGDTVQLADFDLNFMRYQHFKLGAFYYKNQMSFGIGLGVIRGEEFITADLSNANMYTAMHGTELALDLNMQLQRSDTGTTGFGALNGFGLSTDLYFEYQDSDWGSVFVSIEDLGYINWNDRSLTYNRDTAYHYEGFYVNSLEGFNDSVYWDNVMDSVGNAVETSYTKGSVTTALPTWFNIRYSKVLKNPNYWVSSGVRLRFNANYSPYFFLRAERMFNGKGGVGAIFGYGGYGGVNFGLNAYANIKQRLVVGISADNLEGFISPATTGGKSLAARIYYSF